MPATSPDNVFVNCPFDEDYAEAFQALIFAIRACGFLPRSARELDDSGQARDEKLYGLIEEWVFLWEPNATANRGSDLRATLIALSGL